MAELLLGAGRVWTKWLSWLGTPKDWTDLTTLDFNAETKPDIVWDLDKLPWPLENESMDEIHAYDVLEHLGRQGDWKSFFDTFKECYRILKPNGLVCAATVPYYSPWLWGDPGHTRMISGESLTYLCQEEYTKQIGNTAITDYRFYWKEDFDILYTQVKDNHIFWILQALKPSRYKSGK
jgi:SAM-dependent methyltransferase